MHLKNDAFVGFYVNLLVYILQLRAICERIKDLKAFEKNIQLQFILRDFFLNIIYPCFLFNRGSLHERMLMLIGKDDP